MSRFNYRLTLTLFVLLGLTLLLTACSAATKTASVLTAVSAQPTPLSDFTPAVTTDYKPAYDLLEQTVKQGPLYVTANSGVPATALEAGGAIVGAMLRHRDDLAANLRAKGVILAVVGRSETPCDLVYFKGNIDCHRYEASGWAADDKLLVSGCTEKNLLKEPGDPYNRGTMPDSANYCVHQFAKTVLRLALTDSDRQAVKDRYAAAKKEGIWAGDYAMEDYEEFFAEMTQCYFSANVAVARPLHSRGINGPDALKKYDPASYKLVDDVFRGSTNLR